jgi:hypothetical protein
MNEQEQLREQREQKALDALNEPDRAEPKLGRAGGLLRLWHYPSFGQFRAWLLWHDRRAPAPEGYLVRRVTWDRPGEAMRFVHPDGRVEFRFGPEPRLFIADAAVDPVRWRELAEEAGQLRVPPFAFPKFGLGVDGERFGVEQDFFQHKQRFEWWWKPPAGWEPMAEWTERVRDFFEELLARGGNPPSA